MYYAKKRKEKRNQRQKDRKTGRQKDRKTERGINAFFFLRLFKLNMDAAFSPL